MTLYTVIITLVLVLDPFGNIPPFLSILRDLSPKRRRLVILRELLIALLILAAFLFFGQAVLSSMAISQSALRVAGGVILFLIALRMIFPASGSAGSFDGDKDKAKTARDDSRAHPASEKRAEPLIVPLAVPLIAGPSAMAYVILISTQYPEKRLTWMLGLLIAWAVSAVVLILSDWFISLLGDRVLTAIERLMGMILTTLSIQMLLDGLKSFITQS